MVHNLKLESRITAREEGQRLLELLTTRFAYHDSKLWCQMVDNGLVLLNGARAEKEQLLRCGDMLTYYAINHREPEVPTEFETIIETPELLLVGKPAGTPVSQTGMIIHNTFANILRRHYNQDIHLLHRLDRETSGLLLCARTKEFCRLYQKELHQIMLGKYYLAVIRGRLAQPAVTVEVPLAPREDSPIRCRMWHEASGKSCQTIFHEIACNNGYSLVLAELLTGRKHQIRAHLDHLGHPLVGDKIYAHQGKYFLKRIGESLTAEDYRELGAHNHALHAWAARVKLPNQPEGLHFSRMFSPDMQDYLAGFPAWEESAEKLVLSLAARAGTFPGNR